MAGINLSQTDSRTSARFFDKGTVTALICLLLVVAVFGGLRWYIGSLEQQSQALDALLSEKKTVLEGDRVNRLTDVHGRVSYLSEHRVKESREVFTQLEKVLLPAVTLSSLNYQNEDGKISFKAETGNFKTLAQQLQTIKSTGVFSEVNADEIARDQEGSITFSLDAVVKSDKK